MLFKLINSRISHAIVFIRKMNIHPFNAVTYSTLVNMECHDTYISFIAPFRLNMLQFSSQQQISSFDFIYPQLLFISGCSYIHLFYLFHFCIHVSDLIFFFFISDVVIYIQNSSHWSQFVIVSRRQIANVKYILNK